MRRNRRFQRNAPPRGAAAPTAASQGGGDVLVVTEELTILRRDVRCFRENLRGAPYREMRRRSSSYCEVSETIYKENSGEPIWDQKIPLICSKKSFSRTLTQTPTDHSQAAGDGPGTASPSTPSCEDSFEYLTPSAPSDFQQYCQTPVRIREQCPGKARLILRQFQKKTEELETQLKREKAAADAKFHTEMQKLQSSYSESIYPQDDLSGYGQQEEYVWSDEDFDSMVSGSDADTVYTDEFDAMTLEQTQHYGPEQTFYKPREQAEASIDLYEEQARIKAAYKAKLQTPGPSQVYKSSPSPAVPQEPADTSKGAIKKVGLQYFHKIPLPHEVSEGSVVTPIKPGTQDGPPVVINKLSERAHSMNDLFNLMPKELLVPNKLKPKDWFGSVSEPSLTVIRKPDLPVCFPHKLEPQDESKVYEFKSFMRKEPNTRLVWKIVCDELIIYAINHSTSIDGYFKAFLLGYYDVAPVNTLPRTFPLDLSEVMFGRLPRNSTWQIFDHEMVLASLFLFQRYDDLYPKNIYLLIADKLFTTVDGMINFFERDYIVLRDIQEGMREKPKDRASREAQLDTLKLGAMTNEALTVRPLKEVIQQEYIQRLKPPCHITPLPPRPAWSPMLKIPKATKLIQPPAEYALEYLYDCYEVYGSPKVTSTPKCTPVGEDTRSLSKRGSTSPETPPFSTPMSFGKNESVETSLRKDESSAAPDLKPGEE